MRDVFFQAMSDAPEGAHRFVYADWLDENGDRADRLRGEFIRTQCRLFGMSAERKRAPHPDDLAAFLRALDRPSLRHLVLDGLALGNEGARALADNRRLGGLTLLSLSACDIQEEGPGGCCAPLSSAGCVSWTCRTTAS